MSSSITSALAPRSSAPRRRWRRLRYVVLAGLLYTVVGFFVVPPIVKWQLREQLPVYTHRQATVQQVRVNPFTLSLTVRGLALTETNGTPFVGCDELYVNFQLSSLLRWAWTFGDIAVTGPQVNLIQFADGSFNFSDLRTNQAAAGQALALPPVLIQRLVVTNALLTVTDHTTPKLFHTVYGPADLTLKNLSTRPNEKGPYSLEARSAEGEVFAWSGTVSLNPPQSRGKFTLSNIPPAKYEPYLAFFTSTRVARGRLDVSAAYAVRLAGFPPELEVSNAVVQLRDFQLQPPDASETLLAFDELLVQDASASLTNATVRVPLVKQSGGAAFVRRAANGHFEAEQYVHAPTNALVQLRRLVSELQQAIHVPLRASLDELRVENFAVTLEDRSLPSVARLGLKQIQLTVKGVSNQTNAPLSIVADADWVGGGHLRSETTGTLLPLTARTELTVSNLALPPLQPYVASLANIAVPSGALTVRGAAQFDPANTNTPLATFQGEAAITNFLSTDTITFHELARWRELNVRGIDFQLLPTRLALDEVKFTGLRATLAVSSNGEPSVLALRKTPPAPAETTASQPATPATDASSLSGELFPFKLGALVFAQGSLGVVDDSLTPPVQTGVEEFNGSIRDLAYPGRTRAALDLQGKVTALAPFAVTGTLTPDLTNPFADVTINFTNTDLTPFTAYSEKFAGYPLLKGKLAFAVHYHIADRAVQGQNTVTVDQLTFGAHNQSPYATKLPVKLGVALLKDRNGRIALDVPVSGRLDDPGFHIGGVVWTVVKNLLVKAATSPFALLGSLVGGGEEMQYVSFDPGQAALPGGETNKLLKLTKALDERPALNLEISATYDVQKDVAALGREKVREAMKTRYRQELVAQGRPAPPLADVTLDDADYERLLRQAYRTTFNTTPEAALREARSAAVTNAAGVAATSAATPASTSSPTKGAVALIQPGRGLSESQSPTAGGSTPPKRKTERELVREELERRLLTTFPVSGDDVRTLLQRRVEAVQRYLSGPGGVAADRLFPSLPKSGEAVPGGARVVFSLN